MISNKTYRPSWRIRKAYTVATHVLLSYLWLWIKGKILGRSYYDRHLRTLHVRNAERVKRSILELKGLFIKIGQLLSILGSFFPEEFQRPLEALQDKIPPRPIEEVRERIKLEFGKLPGELFLEFNETPVASASIGQVHRAMLPDGTAVAVKVQHAHIEQIASVDLEIIRKLTRIISWFFNIRGMEFAYTQVRQMIEEELDFTREAGSMKTLAKNLETEPFFIIPDVHEAYSTGRVLTTTWHDGVKITRLGQLDEWNVDRQILLTRLFQVYCKMVFKDGIYHADPHPGNILVQPDGTLVLLDFGAVAVLSEKLKNGIPRLIEAAIKNDAKEMITIFRSMGFIAKGQEAELVAEKIIDALRNFLQNEIKLEGLNFRDLEVNPFDNSLLDLINDIGISGLTGTIQVPKDWILLNRMVTLLLGISTTLCPSLNPLDVVRPYLKEFVIGEKETLLAWATGLLRRTVSTSLSLPEEIHRVLNKMEKGELETKTPDIKKGATLIYLAGQQFILALLLIASATFGYLFYNQGEDSFAKWGYGAGIFFLVLLLRSFRVAHRIRRKW